MGIFTISRLATPDEISAEMDRRGAVIEKLETDLRHWREECGKLHSQIDALKADLASAHRGLMPEYPPDYPGGFDGPTGAE